MWYYLIQNYIHSSINTEKNIHKKKVNEYKELKNKMKDLEKRNKTDDIKKNSKNKKNNNHHLNNSEEYLIRNHLNIYNLMKVTEKKRHVRRSSYQLKDLIKLV